MLPSTTFSVLSRDDAAGTTTLKRGRALVLDGVALEAEHAAPGGETLLWLTENDPYDERLHVYLVGRDDSVLDAIATWTDFTPGVLRLDALGPRHVDFRFFATDERWRLTLRDAPRVSLRLPSGFAYAGLSLRHRLTIERLPEEETR
jgi:hypothetical protein